MNSQPKSLFERIGGKPIMDKTLPLFYKKVFFDERINKFFQNINMGKQIRQQSCFLTMLFNGPNNYKGKPLKDTHKGMHITDL